MVAEARAGAVQQEANYFQVLEALIDVSHGGFLHFGALRPKITRLARSPNTSCAMGRRARSWSTPTRVRVSARIATARRARITGAFRPS
jgi:hypothetical protein